MVRVKRYRVQTGERVYLPGEVIEGLSEADEAQLVREGYCEYSKPAELDAENTSGKPESDEKPLTVEEFTALKAGRQKECLEWLELVPESNEAGRIEQYVNWLKQQNGDTSEPDGGGPNTGLPVV